MVKAKDFLGYLCNDLEYRFFSGVPTLGLKAIFNNMSSDFLHYVPAANEHVAISLASGVSFSGLKSVVMLNAKYVIKASFDFNSLHNIPLIVLATSAEDIVFNNKSYVVELTDDYVGCLNKLSKKVEGKGQVGVLYFKEGQLV